MNPGVYSRAPVWMVAAYAGTGNGTYNNVTVSWKDRDRGGCYGVNSGCASIAYIGTSAPDSFSSWGNNLAITNQWLQKNYSQTITLDKNNTIYVALGQRSLYVDGGQQAPAQSAGFDCITVNITVGSQPPP